MKSKIKKLDWIVAITFILLIATRITTLAYFEYVSVQSGESIKNIAKAYEVNPVYKVLLASKGLELILIVLVFPAFVFASYLFIRKKVLKGYVDIDTFGLYIVFLFLIALLNFINDFTLYITTILK